MKLEKQEELELTDHRIGKLEKALVKGSKVLRAFKMVDKSRPKSVKYEVHYLDPKNGLCKTIYRK